MLVIDESVDFCLGLFLCHHLKRRKLQEDFHSRLWNLFICPVIARQANLCSLLISILLTVFLTLRHETVNLWVMVGLINIV